MPSHNEIITLQFGSYANFVGTHFWNTICTEVQQQQELILATRDTSRDLSDAQYEFSRFFREGETAKKQSVFTPRCIIFDERREWSSLKSSGYMYGDDNGGGDDNDDDNRGNKQQQLEILREKSRGMSKFTRTLLASDPSTTQYIQQEYDDDDGDDDGDDDKVGKRNQNYIGRKKSARNNDHDNHLDIDIFGTTWERYDERSMDMSMDVNDDDSSGGSNQNSRATSKNTTPSSLNYTRNDILTELETKSRYWTDFLIPHLHPKSVFKMPNVNMDSNSDDGDGDGDGANNNNSNSGGGGHQVLSVQDIIRTHMDDSMDHIRYALEEADHFDGIQLFSNAGDWWSSVTAQFLPQINDEFGKLSIVSSLVQPHMSIDDNGYHNGRRWNSNRFLSYSALGLIDVYSHSDYVIPMSGNQYMDWNSELVKFGANANAFQWSSVLGTAWESLSRGMDQYGLRNWISRMVPRQGLRIGVLEARMPLGLSTDDNLHDFLMRSGPLNQSHPVMSLYPFDSQRSSSDDLPFAQTVVYRGITDQLDLYKPEKEKKMKMTMEELFIQNVLNSSSVLSALGRSEARSMGGRPERTILSDCNTRAEMLDRYIDQTPSYSTSRCYIDRSSAIPYAYPRVFNTHVLNSHGFIDRQLQQETKKVDSVPMMVHAKTSGDIYDYVSQLKEHLSHVSKRHLSLPGFELTKDELSEKLEIMHRIAEEYRDD